MTRSDYIKFNLSNLLNRLRRPVSILLGLYTILSVFGLLVFQDRRFVSYLIVGWLTVGGFGVIYALIVLRLARHKDNQVYFRERYVEVDEQFVRTIFRDGTETKHKLDNIIRVRNMAAGHFLFVSANTFLFIAHSAFKTAQDYEWFQELLRTRNLI